MREMISFENLCFSKKGADILERVQLLQSRIKQALDDKRSEIQRLCRRHQITAEKLFLNLEMLRGETTAGVPSAEMQKMEKLSRDVDALEREQERLNLVSRNLEPKREFELSFDELRYFEF